MAEYPKSDALVRTIFLLTMAGAAAFIGSVIVFILR